MRRSAIAAIILFALLLGVLASRGGKPLPVGAFRGERRDMTQPGTDPAVAAQLRRIDLQIGEDGRAALEDGGTPWEGLVTRQGDRLEFEVLAVDGQNIKRQVGDLPRHLQFDVLPDGNLRYAGVELTKQPSR